MLTDTGSQFLRWIDTAHSLSHLPWYSRFRVVIDLFYFAVLREEQQYMQAVEEAGKQATRDAPEWMAKLMMEMHANPSDHLGSIYQEASVNDKKRLAQYFTPDGVAAAMAAMTLADIHEEQFTKAGGLKIHEPSCGTGVMCIHAARLINEEFGQWGLNRTSFTLVDKDILCCKIALLQMLWLPYPVAEVVVMHGDSLRREVWMEARFGRGTPPSHTRIVRKTQ